MSLLDGEESANNFEAALNIPRGRAIGTTPGGSSNLKLRQEIPRLKGALKGNRMRRSVKWKWRHGRDRKRFIEHPILPDGGNLARGRASVIEIYFYHVENLPTGGVCTRR